MPRFTYRRVTRFGDEFFELLDLYTTKVGAEIFDKIIIGVKMWHVVLGAVFLAKFSILVDERPVGIFPTPSFF